MEKAYKGMMGSYAVWHPGDEKHDATHRILTKEEYNGLQQKIKELKSQLEEEKKARASDVQKIKEDANARIRAEAKKADEFRETCRQAVVDADRRARNAMALNDNLKRICKENANAKRGLKPKKKHNGFVIVRTQEARDRLPLRRGYQDCRVYKTTVETPYSIHLDIAMAEPMAWNDGLSRFFGSAWENHDANDLASALNDENSDKNFIYRQEWQTGKNNLWEIVCWHTKPLTM